MTTATTICVCVRPPHRTGVLPRQNPTRIATADQRIVCIRRIAAAPHRAATYPATSAKFTTSTSRQAADTNIDHLRLACGQHRKLLGAGRWRTRKLKDSQTNGFRRPLPLPSGTNDYHHPERLLPHE